MDKPINWNAIAAPLDVRQIATPKQYIRCWTNWSRSETGVRFQCELLDGQAIEYRVDVVAPDVVRLRMGMPDVIERPSDMLLCQDFAPVPFNVFETPDCIMLSSSRIRIEFPRAWQVKAFDHPEPGQGRAFFVQRTDDRAYGPGFEVAPPGFEVSADGRLGVRESVAVLPGEAFYGLGEHFTSFDRWNQEVISWAEDSGNVTSTRAYKNIPLLLSSAGYGLFVHSSYPMVFRMGSRSSITYTIHVAEAQLDEFLIYGPSYKQILGRYADLTGHAPLPPKWSFGFWISRAGYRSRTEVEEVVGEFRRRGFPLDVVSLDPWWMGNSPWSTYRWDETAFPNPGEMMQNLKNQGVRTCLWIHPYVPVGSILYAEGLSKGCFVKTSHGSPAPVMEEFSGSQLVAVDFTNPEACVWWQGLLERLMDMGVSVFKTDFGEQAPVDSVYSDGRSGLEMHNLYPLLYNRTAFELTERKNGRGLVWGRSAYAGSQRYPVQWGGDSYATLDQMAGQLRGLLSYGVSGVPFCSHDVGGFDYSPHFFDDITQVTFQESYDPAMKDAYPKDPIVYARWLQFGVFSSHIRAHGKQPHEPWTYGAEVERIARIYLNLRYRLLPYIYTQAAQSARSGLPLVRPLMLEYQDDPNTARLDQEYLFGEDFLVAPVFAVDGWSQFYLPKGHWVDFWSKEIVEGEQWLQIQSPLEILPLWVRGGAIIPYGPEVRYVEQQMLDPLTIELYSPEGNHRLLLEDEDRPGILVEYEANPEHLKVTITEAPGRLELIVYGWQPKQVAVNAQLVDIHNVVNGWSVQHDGRSGFVLEAQA
jgi:alpha-D-xyloside xylohydrolase